MSLFTDIDRQGLHNDYRTTIVQFRNDFPL